MSPKKKFRQTELTFFKKAEKTDTGTIATYLFTYLRSEERRVGKECRSRWLVEVPTFLGLPPVLHPGGYVVSVVGL